MSIEHLARPEIVAMTPYSSARKEAPGTGILLNANEAPWPLLPPEQSDGAALNRYPDPQPEELLRRLAGLYAVGEEQLLVTRGSDEGIDLLTRVFCRAGQDSVLHCPPTFGMYRIAAQAQGAGIVSIPRDAANFSVDEGAVLSAVRGDERIRLVFLTSPNNPTGDVLGDGFLEELLASARGRALVVVDEAYAEFCAQPSAAVKVADHEHLVVLRTLSKAWAAAGLRCGAVIAQPPVIALLRRVIAPYPLPSPVVSLALAMLEPHMLEQQRTLLQRIADNKRLLLEILSQAGSVREIIAGEANFVLIRVDRPNTLLTFCAQRNVILRGFPADPALQGWVRISVGSESDLAQLGRVLEEWEASQ